MFNLRLVTVFILHLQNTKNTIITYIFFEKQRSFYSIVRGAMLHIDFYQKHT